jgi:hypothetical protein
MQVIARPIATKVNALLLSPTPSSEDGLQSSRFFHHKQDRFTCHVRRLKVSEELSRTRPEWRNSIPRIHAPSQS